MREGYHGTKVRPCSLVLCSSSVCVGETGGFQSGAVVLIKNNTTKKKINF